MSDTYKMQAALEAAGISGRKNLEPLRSENG